MAVTAEQRRILLVHLVRDLDTIRAASTRLDVDLWNPHTELIELLCWDVSRNNYLKKRAVVPRTFFSAEIKRLINEHYPSSGINESVIDDVISTIYAVDDSSINFKFACDILQEFVVERKTVHDINSLINDDADHVDVINKMWRSVQQSTITHVESDDISALGIDVFGGMAREATGCLPIDEVMNGIRLDECIGLLGPMKGGKTSLCQSLACDWIKQDKNNKVTFLTYEEPVSALWPKMLICFMNYHSREKMEGKSLPNIDPEIVTDLRNAHSILSKQMNLVDMSGTRGQGYGGASEMEICIENFHRDGELGQLVILDHARPLVMRYMSSKGMDASKQMRFEVPNLCNVFKSVTDRCGVAGLLAHQMSAEGNKYPLRIPSHMDSSECKMFPEMFNQVLCLGVKDKNDIALLNLSASRSMGNRDVHVRIAGWKCRVDLVRGVSANRATGQFETTAVQNSGRLAASEDPSKQVAAMIDEDDDIPPPFPPVTDCSDEYNN